MIPIRPIANVHTNINNKTNIKQYTQILISRIRMAEIIISHPASTRTSCIHCIKTIDDATNQLIKYIDDDDNNEPIQDK
jgi:hypothetical protein